MSHRTKVIFLAILLLLAARIDARAQRVLTLDSAVAIAVRNSHSIHSAELNSNLSGLALHEAELAYSPTIRYNLGASYAPTGRYFGYDPALTNEGQLNAQLSVNAPLYNGDQFGLKQRQASLDVLHSRTSLDITHEGLRFDVTQAFLDDLHAKQNISLERESVTELTGYRDLVDRLFHGGTAAYTDLLKTQVQLDQEQLALEKAISDELQSRYTLAALLGSPGDTLFAVRGAYDSITVFSDARFSLYDSLVTLSMALTQNELAHAQLDIDLARAQAKPTVSVNVDAGLLTSFANITAPPDERFSMVGASAGITVEGPFLDWDLNKVQVQEKEVAVQILQTEVDRQRRELTAQLTQLQSLLRSARERLAHIRDILKRAEDTYDLVKAKYAVGASLASEVLDALKQISDLKHSEVDALNDIETYRANAVHLIAQPKDNTNGK